jgi:hypothetical protein
MSKKITFKKALSAAVGIILYMITVFLCDFLGYVSPALWVMATAVAAIFGAFSIVYLMNLRQGFGILTAVGILWTLLMTASGEVWSAIIPVWCIAFAVLADVVRVLIKSGTRKAIRISYPIFALMPFGQFISLWTNTDTYAEMAAEEMGTESYADGLTAFANPLGFIGVIAAVLVCAVIGERLAETVWKKKFD